jgi:hypothetical protein
MGWLPGSILDTICQMMFDCELHKLHLPTQICHNSV